MTGVNEKCHVMLKFPVKWKLYSAWPLASTQRIRTLLIDKGSSTENENDLVEPKTI